MRIAVVGAGWAGVAAAVAATRAGNQVTLFEATRALGGRARGLPVSLPDGSKVVLDNGQHIMIGAYRQTLELMRTVGVDPAQVLLRLPLVLRFPDGLGLRLPDRATPWNLTSGIMMTRGWSWTDKLSLLLTALRWQRAGFACAQSASVQTVCEGLSPRVMNELIAPLCVSALNTPPARSSGEVFLRVIRDALFGPGDGPWSGSDLLLPRCDLSRVFPDAAAHWLAHNGTRVVLAHRVQAIARHVSGWSVDGQAFDRVALACTEREAARLVDACGASAQAWLQHVRALQHEAITTVYAIGPQPPLAFPMLALRSGPQTPAQFVFDRGQLGGPRGLLAFVVSASQGDLQTLQRQVLAQASALGWIGLTPVQTVVEKRATFACTPGLKRPAVTIADGLVVCGDYVDGPYPATLEGAVRSALEAMARLLE